MAGASSFYPHVARVPSSMPFDQKTPSSPVPITEALPSPLGVELDRSHGAPEKSPPLPGNTHRRRRSTTKGRMPAIIKRSASTPNVRGLAFTDTAGTSLADKRRNKLGYHRTSVACGEFPVSSLLVRKGFMGFDEGLGLSLTVERAGHCRRRKIRCLLAQDDLHGRCSNCIRLKKECNFFPVDQQPPSLDRRPRSESKNDGLSNEASTSSSSSPALSGGHMIEQVEIFNHFRPLAVTSGQHFPCSADPLSASMISPMSQGTSQSLLAFIQPMLTPRRKAPGHHRGLDFAHPSDRASRWDHPHLDHSRAPSGFGNPTSEGSPSAYWRYDEPPMTPAFAHFPAHPNSMVHYPRDHNGSFSISGSREDLAWSLPARSMSFGQVEDLPVNYHHQYHPPSQQDFRRRISSDVYAPPSLDISNNSSCASISEPHSAPVSAPGAGQPRHHFGFPPAWNPFAGHHPGGMINKGPEGIAGWYSEPSPLAKVQEEDLGSNPNGDPPVFYSSAGHHPG